jgi:hypothetical protein
MIKRPDDKNATNGTEWIEIWHSDKTLQSSSRYEEHTILLYRCYILYEFNKFSRISKRLKSRERVVGTATGYGTTEGSEFESQ